jgi:hypothetical protein
VAGWLLAARDSRVEHATAGGDAHGEGGRLADQMAEAQGATADDRDWYRWTIEIRARQNQM